MIVSNAIAEARAQSADGWRGRTHPVTSRAARMVAAAELFLVDRLRPVAIAMAALVLLASCVTLLGGLRAPAVDDGLTGSIVIPARLAPAPAADRWRPVRRPVEVIALPAGQLERLPVAYAAHRRGEDRRDAIAFGTFDDPRPDIEIALLRGPSAVAEPLPLAAARRQAERGVAIVRRGQPQRLATKFGPLDVSEAAFSDDGGLQKACLLFRSAEPPGGIAIEGWMCAAPGAAPERPALACLVDRLAVLRSGEDVALRAYFQEAERQRKPCPVQATAGGRKPTWLDHDGQRPPIRGEDTTGAIRRERQRS
jgi:hypothetical protein